MADTWTAISRDPVKGGILVGLVVVLIGGVVLDLGWGSYLVLLAVVSVVSVVFGVVAAVRGRGGDADRST